MDETSFFPIILAPDQPIADALFAALDTETTGLSPAGPYGDRVVELGAVIFNARGQILRRFNTLVDPERSIPMAAQAVHGISNDHVRGAPKAAEALPALMEFLNGVHMLWGFNSPFDMRFLVGEFLKIGVTPPQIEFYDVRRMLKRCGLPTGSLERVSSALGIRAQRHHRATDDAETTGLVLVEALRAKFSARDPLKSVAHLHSNSSPVYDTAKCLRSFRQAYQ